jgi:hypothetical protein
VIKKDENIEGNGKLKAKGSGGRLNLHEMMKEKLGP